MQKEGLERLARHFVSNAIELAPGEAVWVDYQGPHARPLAFAVSAYARSIGGNPYLFDSGSDFLNKHVPSLSYSDLEAQGLENLARMQDMDAYVRVKHRSDESRLRVDLSLMQAYHDVVRAPVIRERVNNTKWLVTSAPTAAFAQACGMDAAGFDQFYLNVCLLDYQKMAEAVKPLEERMARGEDVHITGEDTDISFSIKGIGARPCVGKRNIPDGECYTAPVKESVNGHILYGPSIYEGRSFEFVRLEFEEGRIICAEAETFEKTLSLNSILGRDEGAGYIGEFALGFNPYITEMVGDILFDEKISGSLHLTPGKAYENETDNGNRSSIHWDLVHSQRPEHGGGEIYFDGELIRKDGLFLPADLRGLNPENLMS